MNNTRIKLIDQDSGSTIGDVSHIKLIPRIGETVRHPKIIRQEDYVVIDVEYTYNSNDTMTVLVILDQLK